MLTDAYLADYAAALGRVVANFASLERSLRSVLYGIGHPPHTALPPRMPLLTMSPDDQVPLNALTSWDTIGQLMTAFNVAHQTRNPPLVVDPTPRTLRDAAWATWCRARWLSRRPLSAPSGPCDSSCRMAA